MKLFTNRIGVSLLLILLASYLWEFHAKPVSGPCYTAAVNEYQNRQYQKSLQLLLRAYEINPNDGSILTLMGWNYLKLGNPRLALENFRRAHRLEPEASDATLGYAVTEIELEHYDAARRHLLLLREQQVDSAEVRAAWEDLERYGGQGR